MKIYRRPDYTPTNATYWKRQAEESDFKIEFLSKALHFERAAFKMACAEIDLYRKELAKLQDSEFHPDWSLLEACRDLNQELLEELAKLRTSST
jgi:hypothetical protein